MKRRPRMNLKGIVTSDGRMRWWPGVAAGAASYAATYQWVHNWDVTKLLPGLATGPTELQSNTGAVIEETVRSAPSYVVGLVLTALPYTRRAGVASLITTTALMLQKAVNYIPSATRPLPQVTSTSTESQAEVSMEGAPISRNRFGIRVI